MAVPATGPGVLPPGVAGRGSGAAETCTQTHTSSTEVRERGEGGRERKKCRKSIKRDV